MFPIVIGMIGIHETGREDTSRRCFNFEHETYSYSVTTVTTKMSKAKDTDMSDLKTRESSFPFEDNVKFTDLFEDEIPGDFVFPRGLNESLRDQIQNLRLKNSCLRRALDKTEEELKKAQSESIPEVTHDIGKCCELTTLKIVEMSQKYREQVTEIEVLKTKCESLENKLLIKEAELKSMKFRPEGNSQEYLDPAKERRESEEQLLLKEDQIRQLKEKLQQVNAKLCETRSTCTLLKQEINKAQKLLCSEVGENVTIASLSNHPGGWRGRAEQVQQLQQKVSDLQARLNKYERTPKGSSASMEQRNLSNLCNMEKERRQQLENSARELRQAEVALETYKRKLDASKARIKVLENDLNNAKGNIILLNEKRAHDDQLIDALNAQLRALEARYQDREMDFRNQKEKLEHECIGLRNDMNAACLNLEQTRKRLEEREIEICKLRSSHGVTKSQKVYNEMTREIRESPVNTARSCRDQNEYVTLSIAAEAERERLLELITVLNRRLDKERNDTDEISEMLRLERNRSAKLKSKLQKLEMERVGIAKVNTGYRSRSLKSTSGVSNENLNEQARFRLEFLQEECLALKTRLATIVKEKAVDLASYKVMLDQTRKTFQEACRGKLPTGGCHSTVTI
ncbi:coiled-coil domain-containing protein 13 [Orussus abietinus]|uniref:coiled-coil domain-containing protein 13 n=1 Tax=Orussus abietinus TaxID=222816 RepID=UPI00062541A5|nr:coiled-coil domain-containing protein 13 [Orussus abietinus]